MGQTTTLHQYSRGLWALMRSHEYPFIRVPIWGLVTDTIYPLSVQLSDPSGPSCPILTNLKFLVLHTRFGKNWARTFRYVENMNLYMFCPLTAPRGHISLIYTN